MTSAMHEHMRHKFSNLCLNEILVEYVHLLLRRKRSNMSFVASKLDQDHSIFRNFFSKLVPSERVMDHLRSLILLRDFFSSPVAMLVFHIQSMRKEWGAGLDSKAMEMLLDNYADISFSERGQVSSTIKESFASEPCPLAKSQLFIRLRKLTPEQVERIMKSSASSGAVQTSPVLSSSAPTSSSALSPSFRAQRAVSISLDLVVGTTRQSFSGKRPEKFGGLNEVIEEDEENDAESEAADDTVSDPIGEQVCSMSGWVKKKSTMTNEKGKKQVMSTFKSQYQRRFLAIKLGVLYWYKSDKSSVAQNSLSLAKVIEARRKENRPCKFQIIAERGAGQYKLSIEVDRPEQCDQWVSVINREAAAAKQADQPIFLRIQSDKIFDDPTDESLFREFPEENAPVNVKAAAAVVALEVEAKNRNIANEEIAQARELEVEMDGCPSACSCFAFFFRSRRTEARARTFSATI
eukprot:GILI01012733.1.p1 GENE.GILI01012733.1~~GILI01012733.1.p1  ORF type:complete len:502 (-),score=154.80 GILI01012733.1:64-1455(-)